MPVDARRFVAEVFDRDGRRLGEARLWGSAERTAEGATWRGWLRVADLEDAELPSGPLTLRLADGGESSCELLGRRLSRFGEQDLAPIQGAGEPPWSEEAAPARYRAVWNETPPRLADDRPALNRLAGVVAAVPELIAAEIATGPYLTQAEQERADRLRRERSRDRAASPRGISDPAGTPPIAGNESVGPSGEPAGADEWSETQTIGSAPDLLTKVEPNIPSSESW